MRNFITIAALLYLSSCGGCAGHSCCRNCCLITAALGVGTAFAFADAALDDVTDPRPENTDTEAGKRKLWEWEQRQQADSVPTLD